MTIPYLQIVVVAVCAIVFYRAGQMERSWGLLWGVLSLAASVLALYVLRWGFGGLLLGQVVLFCCITFYRMWRMG